MELLAGILCGALIIGCIIFILWIIVWAFFAFTDDDDEDEDNLLYVPARPDGTVMGHEIVNVDEDEDDLQ